MIKSNDYDYLKRICETNVCREHGKKLTAAWHAGVNAYVIRCGEGHFPEEITREFTPIEEHKAGKREAFEPIQSLLPSSDLATGEVITTEQRQGLIGYARRYDLDPFRGHVVLMYSKPYITIDGYLYHAATTGVPYRLMSRPLSEDERKTFMIGPEDHAWHAEIELLARQGYFSGLGTVTQEEMTATSKKDQTKLASPVVAAHPWQLAQKRAEWQALRRAFPIGESKEINNETRD